MAGCEAAFQLSLQKIPVQLIEMKPKKFTPAHKSSNLAELVCSNSLKSDSIDKAAGILKNEMVKLKSLVLEAAYENKVSAGGALAVDREKFAQYITNKISKNDYIKVVNEEVTEINFSNTNPIIIASGPMTSNSLAKEIENFIGTESLSFYDSISPIILYDSLDKSHFFRASRYEDGEGDYINCPLTKVEYINFIESLNSADKIDFHEFEKVNYFESCLPIEEMAARGLDTLRFGPMKPVGLTDPKTARRPYAVLQLRKENEMETMWNLVGFQTKMRIGDQKKVFSIIPALRNAEFLRFGSIHRNTYINSPGKIKNTLQSENNEMIFFAGQITGVEGYTESAAMGIVAGINAGRAFKKKPLYSFTKFSALGILLDYISKTNSKELQPMNINLGLFGIEKPKKNIEIIQKNSKKAIDDFMNSEKYV